MHISSGPAVRLRKDVFVRRGQELGIDSDRAWAARLGVAPTTVTRLFADETKPGNGFIARALRSIPNVNFDDLFEVVG
jgi:hypothetical protein